jgi:hypothetical protein
MTISGEIIAALIMALLGSGGVVAYVRTRSQNQTDMLKTVLDEVHALRDDNSKLRDSNYVYVRDSAWQEANTQIYLVKIAELEKIIECKESMLKLYEATMKKHNVEIPEDRRKRAA